MKKIVIPTILVATILVAASFAIMPIEKASTVHSSVGTTIKARTTAVAVAAVTLLAAPPAGTTQSGEVSGRLVLPAGSTATITIENPLGTVVATLATAPATATTEIPSRVFTQAAGDLLVVNIIGVAATSAVVAAEATRTTP